MTTELKPDAFLQKLVEVAPKGAEPLRVEIVRQPVPIFVEVGDRIEYRDAVLVVYRFRYDEEDYLAREYAPFESQGDADLGRLIVWPTLSRSGAGESAAANGTPPPLKNVRPVLTHRSGSV